MDPEEDAQNKQDRPLPAGRISLRNAVRLRWALVPTCFALSALYSSQAVYASFALVVLTIIYNELEAHKPLIIRNIVNALGFATFEIGATLIAGTYTEPSTVQLSDARTSGADPTRLDSIGVCSIIASAGIFASTIHAQDFKDVDGDRAIGRRTVPIVFPRYARLTVIIPLLLWSSGLSVFWNLDIVTSALFISLSLYVGAVYLVAPGIQQFQVAFYWYNVCASCSPHVRCLTYDVSDRFGCPWPMRCRPITALFPEV